MKKKLLSLNLHIMIFLFKKAVKISSKKFLENKIEPLSFEQEWLYFERFISDCVNEVSEKRNINVDMKNRIRECVKSIAMEEFKKSYNKRKNTLWNQKYRLK